MCSCTTTPLTGRAVERIEVDDDEAVIRRAHLGVVPRRLRIGERYRAVGQAADHAPDPRRAATRRPSGSTSALGRARPAGDDRGVDDEVADAGVGVDGERDAHRPDEVVLRLARVLARRVGQLVDERFAEAGETLEVVFRERGS